MTHFNEQVKKSSSQSLIKLQAEAHLTNTNRSIYGSNTQKKEMIRNDTIKEHIPKAKSGVSKKGLDGGSGATKVDATGSSTKKLIFSFKKDSKGITKAISGAPNKNVLI